MNIALFIDGDNVNSSYCEACLVEAGKLGEIRVKSVFGRCDTFSGKGWKGVAQAQGIQIYPQVNNLRGKSAADIALVIEVMRQLEMKTCEGVVIVSNDTDYTALVYEIKRQGIAAYCFITKETDNVFVKSCDAVRVLHASVPKVKAVPAKTKPVLEPTTKPVAPKPAVPKIKTTKSKPQPKKGTYRQIAVAMKKMGCRTEKAIRNKIKSDYFKTATEIDLIIDKMKSHNLVVFDANGHATWAAEI